MRESPSVRDPRLSAAICIARVLGIAGIVYVHGWTGLAWADLTAIDGSPQGIFRWTLMEFLGRSAVPLLSIISGWLVAGSALKRSYAAFLTGKARALLLPMILWNAIAIVLVSGAAHIGWINGPHVRSTWWVIDELFCLATPNDINVQMAFLRDLFVCMVFAPLLVRLPNWALAGVMAWMAFWTISWLQSPMLLRPMIALFFVGGVLAQRIGFERRALAFSWAAVLAPLIVMIPLKIWLTTQGDHVGDAHPHLMVVLDIAARAAASLLLWKLAWALAGQALAGHAGAARLLRAERYAFLMFSSHLVLIWTFGPAIGSVTGPAGSPLYPAYLVLQPLLAFGGAVLIGQGLIRFWPAAAEVLSGGRLKRPAHAAPSAMRLSSV